MAGPLRLTEEQQAVVRAAGRVIKVNAYAGTGKSATLAAWARAHPRLRILYLAYNGSVRKAAQRRFPRSTIVHTTHSLAWEAGGSVYADKLADGGLQPWAWVQAGCFAHVPAGRQLAWADLIARTLTAFMIAPDPEITRDHWPLTPEEQAGAYAWADPARGIPDARRLWRRMQDPNDKAVAMVHDGYLKRYVIAQPRWPVGAVLFDESQDANPLAVQMVQLQSEAIQVWVGDPWQALYGFRGAVNALGPLRADTTLRLTGSFRFGPELARVATRLLRWHDSNVPALRGLAKTPGRVTTDPAPRGVWIARTNARLFSAAIDCLTERPDVQFGWVGGIAGYGLGRLYAVFQLWAGDPVTDPFVSLFPDFDAFCAYCETVEDPEWQGRITLVQRWGRGIPVWVTKIRRASRGRDPDVWFSTVHKAKGLEWPVVRLLDDLPALDDGLIDEDQHLWYVAATRAHQALHVPPKVASLLLGQSDPPKPHQAPRVKHREEIKQDV